MTYTIGIDVGTTGCKALIAESSGKIAGQDYIEYPLILRSSKMVEQDAGLWWELVQKAVANALAKSGVDPSRISAISVASQGLSFVLTDREFNPIGNAISWLDSRARAEIEEIAQRYPCAELYRLTGLRASELYVLPKLLWMKKHCPATVERARHLLMAHDFIIAKLTGNAVTDHTMAGGTMLYNVSEKRWEERLIRDFGIDAATLPEIKASGTVAGELLPGAARRLGLREGTPVVVGGQDQKVAAFAVQAGAEMDTATLSLGTAGAMEFVTDRPVFDEQMRIPVFPYTQKERWTLESVVSTAGASLKWLKNTLFKQFDYAGLDALAECTQPASGGLYFYPHLSGASSPHWNPEMKGTFFGIGLYTRTEDVVRSVLEGTAFQVLSNLRVCEALGGQKSRIKVFGSGGRSRIWCRILADVTGKCIVAMPSPDAAGLGAAKLACRAVNPDIEAYENGVCEGCNIIEPDEKAADVYRAAYQKYIEVENKLAGAARTCS